MGDFFEIDFLDVETTKSGDAIPLRYALNDITWIHVVDGGFQDSGEKVCNHIRQHYGAPSNIDRVIVTHPDRDHAGGLRTVLEQFRVGQLWMLRPWLYAEEIIARFANYTSVENLKRRLRQVYPNVAALEEIAIKKNIPIYEPFQGVTIGEFTVLAPTKHRYLNLIVESERTPESIEEAEETTVESLGKFVGKVAAKAINFLKGQWGDEVFSVEDTSAENEMSVIQYANLCGKRILLTADAGRSALTEAANYAPNVGLVLPGIDRFQVPHHGSRRNVSTEVLDRWLGERWPAKPEKGQETFTAIISSAKKDEDHPRKSVVRAFYHRGANVVATEGKDLRTHQNAPPRLNWVAAQPLEYPEEQEE